MQIGTYLVERGRVPAEVEERYLTSRRSDVPAEAINLLGTPEAVTARLREYIDAGATKFVFNPACGAGEMFDQLQLQAEAIVQPFHQGTALDPLEGRTPVVG